MEGDLISVRYNGLFPKGTHHWTHDKIIPKYVGAAVVCSRRPAKVNETPKGHCGSRVLRLHDFRDHFFKMFKAYRFHEVGGEASFQASFHVAVRTITAQCDCGKGLELLHLFNQFVA